MATWQKEITYKGIYFSVSIIDSRVEIHVDGDNITKSISNGCVEIQEFLTWYIDFGKAHLERVASFEDGLSRCKASPKHAIQFLQETKSIVEIYESYFLSRWAKEIVRLHLNGGLAEFLETEAKKIRDARRGAKEGSVYLIKAENGLCKIGKTKNIESRMSQFKSFPVKWVLMHSFKTRNHHKAERKLHERFCNKRVNGEWFNLDEEDIDFIKSIGDFRF